MQPLSPDRQTGAQQTKNPSEGCCGCLIKSHLAYRQTKTRRKERTRIYEASDSWQLFSQCGHHICWRRKHTWGLTQIHWVLGEMGSIPSWFSGKWTAAVLSPDHVLQVMPLEAGGEGWWRLDLNQIQKHHVDEKSYIAAETPLCLHKPQEKRWLRRQILY